MSDAPDLLAALVRSVEMARKERLETTMTPVDRLTRAADTLDALVDAATPGAWEVDINTHKVKPIIGERYARTVAFMPGLVDDDGAYGQFHNHEDARLIALTSDPATVRLIAAILREDQWGADEITALADHINGKDGS